MLAILRTVGFTAGIVGIELRPIDSNAAPLAVLITNDCRLGIVPNSVWGNGFALVVPILEFTPTITLVLLFFRN